MEYGDEALKPALNKSSGANEQNTIVKDISI